MKVALVHYWLVGMRGGEKVVEALLDLYPEADVYTHVLDRGALGEAIASRPIRTTFIQKLPRARRWYQLYLPLMPLALESLDLSGYDLVISSESGPAKGVLTRPETLHVCYCHTPMRYVWDMHHEYMRGLGRLKRLAAAPLLHYLRMWDFCSAGRVDAFVANSSTVAARIAKHYRREAEVIHPPVQTERFTPSSAASSDYYLLAGQLVGYKRADLAIRAFSGSGRRLVVAGDGEEMGRLKALAGAGVELRGRVSDTELAELYAGCRALVFPGEEDFGIVPVEAMAAGRPVIALARGGALDTVQDGETGLLFREQTAASLNEALARFESMESRFDPQRIAAHAARFDAKNFRRAFHDHVEALLEERADSPGPVPRS